MKQLKNIQNVLQKTEQRALKLLIIPMIINGLLNVIGISVIFPFIAICMNPDSILQHKKINLIYHYLKFSNENHFLIFIGFLVLATLALSNGFSILTTFLMSRTLGKVYRKLSDRFMASCMMQPYQYFLNTNSAVLSTDLTKTIYSFVNNYLFNLLSLVTRVVSIVFLVSALVLASPMVAVICISVLSATFICIYFLIRKKLYTFREKTIKNVQQSYKVAMEAFQGIKAHKLSASESYYVSKYDKHLSVIIEESNFSRIISVLPRNILEIVSLGLIISVVIALISLDNQFTTIMPTLAFFAFAGYRILPSLQQLFQHYSSMKVHSKTGEILDSYFRQFLRQAKESELAVSNVPFNHLIKTVNLDYRYSSRDKLVLNSVNIVIPHNNTVGFIGSTGSGKTTLIDNLLGLLEPTAGSIFVDDKMINQSNFKGWQSNIGYVPQHIFLSDCSISENIALGIPKEKVDMLAVMKAAKLAQIHDFITNILDDGYDTIVGDRGIQLSGGERQRIGIARALYHDPNVLILDEATSALDLKTEREVMKAIRNLKGNKTIIMIAHRLSTIEFADIVYFMKDGRVIDHGSLSDINSRHDIAMGS